MKVCVALFAVLLAVTSCDELTDLLGGADDDGASLGIDTKSYEVGTSETTITISLTTLLGYWTNINEGGEWITESSSYETNNINYHTFTISANLTADERVGKIGFYASGDISSIVTVTQDGQGSTEVTLEQIDANNIPEGNIWIITDSKADSGVRQASFDSDGTPLSVEGEGDFYNLYNALINASNEGRSILLEFPNLEAFPAGALFDVQNYLDNPDYWHGEDGAQIYDGIAIEPAYSYSTPRPFNISAAVATEVGDFAFANMDLTYIDLPEVESLGRLSFTNVYCGLPYTEEYLIFPKVKTIGQGAFMNFTTFDSITLIFPEALEIGKAAFYCSYVQLLNDYHPIEEEHYRLTYGDDWEEYYNADLAEYESFGNYCHSFPVVESIGEMAFYTQHYILDRIYFPCVKSVGDYAFYASDLSDGDVMLPMVETIGANAFAWCNDITSFTAENLEELGECAFMQCSSLKTVTVPRIHTIGYQAFYVYSDVFSYFYVCYEDGVTAKSFAEDIFGTNASWNDFIDTLNIYTGGDNGTSVTPYSSSGYSAYSNWTVPDGNGGTHTYEKLKISTVN